MVSIEVAAANEPLDVSYRLAKQLNAEHGKTYYLATLLLPAAKRPFVHALYGFARAADDIVDVGNRSLADKRAALTQLQADFGAAYSAGITTDPVLAAVIDTAMRWQIDKDYFDAFFTSMAADLTVTEYADYAALQEYMYGSASVIGHQVLPILEPTTDEAGSYAAKLGEAFQLANFIRDVGEDLDRGRIYLPLDELARFGVNQDSLAQRQVTDSLREALQFQIDRVHSLADEARPGIEMLHPSVRDCIATALVLYTGIADAVAKSDYRVFDRRAKVPRRRRLTMFGKAYLRSIKARRRYGPGEVPEPLRQIGGPGSGTR